jgi:carbamoyl-phosphate synthase large subunit
VLPPHTLGKDILKQIKENTRAMAGELAVVGLMNVQYTVKDGKLFVLEVTPRASRTIPFVSKATGIPFARMATKVMLGRSLAELGLTQETIPDHVASLITVGFLHKEKSRVIMIATNFGNNLNW